MKKCIDCIHCTKFDDEYFCDAPIPWWCEELPDKLKEPMSEVSCEVFKLKHPGKKIQS